MPKIQTKGNEKNMEFLLSLLVQHIQSFHVLGAIEVYELLEKAPRGIEKLEDNIKQDLLELLCYHNSEEEMDSESHQQIVGMYSDDKSLSWRTDGLAEKLYSDIVTNTRYTEQVKSRARLALLCGKGKFKGVENSRQKLKFEETKKNTGVMQLKEECQVCVVGLSCVHMVRCFEIFREGQ